jgi:hypothetical protein
VMQTGFVLTGGGWTSSNLAVTPRKGHFIASDTIGAGPDTSGWFLSEP